MLKEGVLGPGFVCSEGCILSLVPAGELGQALREGQVCGEAPAQPSQPGQGLDPAPSGLVKGSVLYVKVGLGGRCYAGGLQRLSAGY